MATNTRFNVDLNSVFAQASAQFRGLNPSEPGQWPWLPKIATFAAIALAVVAIGWFVVLSPSNDELQGEVGREPGLKADYRAKLTQAINLNELRKQKVEVQEYVTQLEKQLPGKAEMDALLSDINQAGLGRGLQFELFRPGSVVVKDYYAELPISIRVSGRYHDIGSFAADVANLSRIVTLHDLSIARPQVSGAAAAPQSSVATGSLTMDALARTYRYLDPAEVEVQRQAKTAAAKKGGQR